MNERTNRKIKWTNQASSIKQSNILWSSQAFPDYFFNNMFTNVNRLWLRPLGDITANHHTSVHVLRNKWYRLVRSWVYVLVIMSADTGRGKLITLSRLGWYVVSTKRGIDVLEAQYDIIQNVWYSCTILLLLYGRVVSEAASWQHVFTMLLVERRVHFCA